MGRGTKHKTDWKPTTLQTAIDARRLYTHTVKIIGNPKVFKPENDYHNVTLNEIHKTVIKIYMCIWKANRINAVLQPERADERLALQASALDGCTELLALIELAKGQFHVPSGKFWYWADMCVMLGEKVGAWRKSEKTRYKMAVG